MRILLLVDCYSPQSKSSATQMHDLAMELPRQKHEVIVLTPSDRISEKMEIHDEDGIQVVRVRTGKIKGAAKAFRAIGEARLSGMLWRTARRFLINNRADLIVFYSPTIFWGDLVQRLKALWNCPAYLILRDIFPAWAVDAGLLRKGLIYSLFRQKERLQYAVADRIAVQSPANLDYFAKDFPSYQNRLEVLYNWMNLREEDLPRTNYREQLGWQGKIVYFYGGNLGVAQDVDNIVRLAVQLDCNDAIRFLLVGEGSEVPRLRKWIEQRNIHNLRILPAVSHHEYLAMLSEFDVGLLSLDRRLTSYNVPGKLLGYMYWAKPVLASVNPGNDLFALLGENQAGLCLQNGDDVSFCDGALKLANDSALRARMGINARRLLEKLFSVETAAAQITRHWPAQEAAARGIAAAQTLRTRIPSTKRA